MKLFIIDNSGIKKIKLFNNKIKLGYIYKGSIKKYFIKNFNLKYNLLINIFILQSKKNNINSFNKIKFNYNNNCGITLNNNFNPIGNKINGIVNYNIYYKNLKLLFININEKI